MIGVLIFEDNNDLRESLVNLITYSKDLLLLGAYPRAVEAARQVGELKPDVILMDIDMPGLNGIQAVREIRLADKNAQIIMITIFDDSRHVLDAICAGANGYLHKKHVSSQLPDAIRQVMAGESPMSPGIARMIVDGMHQSPGKPGKDYKLTTREKEILTHLSKGKGFKMMASELGISVDTVKVHIRNTYEKLQVHTQAEAVSKALNEKIV